MYFNRAFVLYRVIAKTQPVYKFTIPYHIGDSRDFYPLKCILDNYLSMDLQGG